jgi:hypothetical protein
MTLKAVARDLLPPVMTRTIKRALKSADSIPKAPADDLMMWMGFVNPGMLYSGNIDLFAYCIDNLPLNGSAVSFDDYRNHLIETFRRNVVLFSGNRLPHHIELRVHRRRPYVCPIETGLREHRSAPRNRWLHRI